MKSRKDFLSSEGEEPWRFTKRRKSVAASILTRDKVAEPEGAERRQEWKN